MKQYLAFKKINNLLAISLFDFFIIRLSISYDLVLMSYVLKRSGLLSLIGQQ